MAAPRNEFLATNRTFGDFELRLEYRLDCVKDCNAGIQFRTVRIPNDHEVIGYQADIGPAYEGCLYDESRRNAILATASKEAVAQAHTKAKDGWNEYVIRCEGRRIRLSINGVETVNYTENDATIPQEGVIALQIHRTMVGTIRFRNIRIEEFPPLLASDFRLAPAAEGWGPSKAPTPFEGDAIRRAYDPDEHGIRIRKGQLMSKPFAVKPFDFYRLRFLAQAAEKPLCAAVFSIRTARRSWPTITTASTPPPTGPRTRGTRGCLPAPSLDNRQGSDPRSPRQQAFPEHLSREYAYGECKVVPHIFQAQW